MATSADQLAGRSNWSMVRRLSDALFQDATRTIQTVLGLIWLLDGVLQFQTFMYSQGFPQMLNGMAMQGQPQWLSRSLTWATGVASPHLTFYNTVFGLVQVLIGLGLLFRPTVRIALAVSFGWALIVWWFGEAFGMLFMNMANPLTGAPGAVLLYALIGAMVWPNGRPGGLLGVRNSRVAWMVLWLVMAWMWLVAANSNPNATHDAIQAAPSGMSWLTSLNNHVASWTSGHGLLIAVVLAIASVAIGVAVGTNHRARPFLILAIALNAIFWVVGQGFGGIATNQATDPNAGPLFILLAATLYTLVPVSSPATAFASASAPMRPGTTPA
jgi:hypothetical protein